jgi:hypothetical protein
MSRSLGPMRPVVVGSLRFRRLAAAPGSSQPPAPVVDVLARKLTYAVLMPPPAATAAPVAVTRLAHACVRQLANP